MISERIYSIRTERHMSQEAVAEKLGVSRQSIQKWEAGDSQPTVQNLITLSRLFGVSVDYFCGNSETEVEANRMGIPILPSYEKQYLWDSYFKALGTEYRQSFDEGKDIAKYEELFKIVSQLPDNKYKSQLAEILFSIVTEASQRDDFGYYEPNSLDAILASRNENGIKLRIPAEKVLSDKMLGGWFGRICGCLLGKPVECMYGSELNTVLKKTGNFPLRRYIEREEITPEVAEGILHPIMERAFPRNIGYMPSDDDTNYMLLAVKLIERYGRDFTSENVLQNWISSQLIDQYCTAERVAYRNYLNGYQPPESAEYQNPYREWIGAQIRGDVYGYINPCNPEEAASMAYRDAAISHIKNGIYGEMWVSAMIAAAFGTDNLKDIINIGLSQVPRTSRFYEAVSKVVSDFEAGVSESDFFDDFHKRWNEKNSHDWTHVISNAEIVAASLLYGNGDYGKSICISVAQAFDTDCNGATVGSVLGVRNGFNSIPKEWTAPVNDTLESGFDGHARVSITEMAQRSLRLATTRQR